MAHMVFPLWFLSSLLSLAALQGLQAVDYEVINNATGTPGGTRFTTEIGVEYAKQKMKSISEFIWQTFEQPTQEDRKNFTQVTLIVQGNSSWTYPKDLEDNKIVLFAQDIADISGDIKKEFMGELCVQMVSVWQWTGQGQAPIILMSGIEKYVYLTAGYIYSDFTRPGQGDRWDDDFEVTARFLEYCNSLRNGFVADLNGKMKTSYSPEFFVELLGKNIDQLWTDYKAVYKN